MDRSVISPADAAVYPRDRDVHDDRPGAADAPSLLNPLAVFGISAAAETVWRCLLDNPTADRDEVAQQTGLTGSTLEVAISSLLRARLVRQSTGRMGVTVVEPVLAVEAQIAQHEREVARNAEHLANLRSTLPELANKYSLAHANDEGQPSFELITNLAEVRHQIYLATDRARYETRGFDHLTTEAALQHAQDTDIRALGRGLKERSIFAASALTQPGVYAEIEILHKHGHHIRTLPDVPTRMAIFDTDLMVLPVDPDVMSLGAIFVRTKSLIKTFIYMFDRLWEDADPAFGETTDAGMPSARAVRVLELMAIGTKDERIARSLGVGVRTIRRDVAEIRATLGVNSRAEITAAAVRRGWL